MVFSPSCTLEGDGSKALVAELLSGDAGIDGMGAEKAPEGFQKGCGTVLCIGNGGCEFSMKNEDGTPDKSANPTNNSCQSNVLKLAKNSVEYLMSI